jgi:hypothetical protein
MEGKIILEGIPLEEFLKLIEKREEPDKLMTHSEVMEELGIKRTQYHKLKKAGLIPVRGLGTLERVLKSELYASFEKIERFLEAV